MSDWSPSQDWRLDRVASFEGVGRVTVFDRQPAGFELFAPADDEHVEVKVTLRAHATMNRHEGKVLFEGVADVGAVDLLRPGEGESGQAMAPWVVVLFGVPVGLLASALDQSGGGAGPHGLEMINPAWRVDPTMLAIARRARAELADEGALSRLLLDLMVQETAIHLLRAHSNAVPSGGGSLLMKGGLAPRQLRRACDAMLSRIDGDISLVELAAVAGCSPTHFSRAFRQSTGRPPFAWLLERRVARAKELLADPALPIAQIALEVGFSAQPQFTTAFKRIEGTTPGAWRRARGGGG